VVLVRISGVDEPSKWELTLKLQTIMDRIAVPIIRPYVSDCSYRSSAVRLGSASEVDMVAMRKVGVSV
jgi:hypothetical protein